MPPTNDHHAINALPIVGIGGSAGSLQSLKSFLANLPADTGAAYIIVTHHPKGERSLLPDILGPHTALPVQLAEEGKNLVSDSVYVAVPDDGWILCKGQLVRSEGSREGAETDTPAYLAGVPHPIDTLFRSLAEEAGHCALAVVLSGTGSDGTLGITAIKSQAGMVMAEDPNTAEYGDMPANAIATHQVDYVLPVEDMPATLAGYLSTQSHRQTQVEYQQHAIPPDMLRKILHHVRYRTGHDFSGYKVSTLNRRLERRMDLRQILEPQTYLVYLQDHPEEVDLLFQEFLISVTNFFRDPRVWASLRDLLPAMLKQSVRTGQEFRAWVPGCATGEEAYTLAILIQDCIADWEQPPTVRIFATDVDQSAIEKARVGRYPSSIGQDLGESQMQLHFNAESDTVRINRDVRDMVVFAEHNVLQDPPFTSLDIITCRNLMIYLERDQQERLLLVFRYALRSQGLMMLGPSESLDHQTEAFSVVDKDSRIYRVAEGYSTPRLLDMPSPSRHRRSLPFVDSARSATQQSSEALSHNVECLLALQFAPPAVVVNDRGEVIYVHGRTGRFLEPASGPARNQLLEMARPGLRAPLSQALQKVSSGDTDHVSQQVEVLTDGDSERVRLDVRMIRTPKALAGFHLVAMQVVPLTDEVTAANQPEGANIDAADTHSGGSEAEARLTRKLDILRQEKEIALKEMQAANQELQSLNEELQSMNEELQSSNEELEAAKEEVESLNQELRSVNGELNIRVDDLTEVNDDLKNLLDSPHLATLFLDESLNIKRFTAPVQKLIAVRTSDIGRPLSELTTKLCYDSLLDDADAVLDNLVTKEIEVQTKTGHWYLLRVQPYRSTRNVIRGVVCTFQDIQAAHSIAKRETMLRSVVDTLVEPLLVLDPTFQVVTANNSFYSSFLLPSHEVEGKSLFDLRTGKWDHPVLRTLLAEVLPEGRAFENFELSMELGDPDPACLRINGRPLELESGSAMILLTIKVQRT